MRKTRDIVCLVYLVLAVAAASILTIFPPTYSSEDTLQKLLSETILRLILLSAVVLLAFAYGYHKRYPLTKESWKKIYWILPCLLSVLANFPFSALISGTAVIDYPNYLWLYIIYCLSIGVLEEVLFRLVLLDFLIGWLQKKNHGMFLAVLLDAVIFALYHLMNLFVGAAVGPTMLQVGYSFLVGGMFAISFLRTKNFLVPLFLHTIFDFGGFIVTMLGHGPFQAWAWTVPGHGVLDPHWGDRIPGFGPLPLHPLSLG